MCEGIVIGVAMLALSSRSSHVEEGEDEGVWGRRHWRRRSCHVWRRMKGGEGRRREKARCHH